MPTIAELEKHLFRAWDAASARVASLGLDGVSRAERMFLAVWELEAEVNNGGFDQYLLNSGADEASVAREALVEMGAASTLAVLDDFARALPGGAPAPERSARHAQLGELEAALGEDGAAELLRALDERFYATEDELRDRMALFVERHTLT